jgi:hypothetical protein
MLVEEAPIEASDVFPGAVDERETFPSSAAPALWVAVALAVCAIGGLGFYFWNRAPTQLELYNTGDKPLLVRRCLDGKDDARVVVPPGGTYHAPHVAGDALRVSAAAAAAGQSGSSPETLVILDFRRPTATDPPRVIAEAFADPSGSVVFRYPKSIIEVERLSREAALRDAFVGEPSASASVTATPAPATTRGDKFDASFEGEGRADSNTK